MICLFIGCLVDKQVCHNVIFCIFTQMLYFISKICTLPLHLGTFIGANLIKFAETEKLIIQLMTWVLTLSDKNDENLKYARFK